MTDLDMIVLDLIEARLKAGDAISIHFSNQPRGENWLLAKLEIGRFVPGTTQRSPAISKGQVMKVTCAKFSYHVPGGIAHVAVPLLLVPRAVDMEQIGRGIFQVNINNTVRRTPPE